jgi:aspartyl-tRNA synthetase
MQLDVEMTFADQEDVQSANSQAVLAATSAVRPGEAPSDIPRMTWTEAMEYYGVDKPDTRFGMTLVELTELFEATDFNAFAAAPAVKGIRVEGAGDLGRSKLDALTERAKSLGSQGLVWMRVRDGGALESPVAKFLSEAEQLGIVDMLGARPGDLALLVAGDRPMVREVLGQLRLDLGRPPVTEGLEFTWVVEFPLFEGLDEAGRPMPAHHAFTAPHPDDLARLESDPLSVRSRSYDLVLNGWELGSGSERIYRPEVQQRIFSLLGIDPEEAEAFRLPAGRARLGAAARRVRDRMDRRALLAGEENIREVIALPKTQPASTPDQRPATGRRSNPRPRPQDHQPDSMSWTSSGT